MLKATIFHNPRCSKSRQTLALLEEKGIEVEVVEYLKSPPTPEILDEILRKLRLEPTAIVRRKEKTFSELGLSLEDDRRRRGWLEVLCANPVLLERPIVVVGERAALGRPPEAVAEILRD